MRENAVKQSDCMHLAAVAYVYTNRTRNCANLYRTAGNIHNSHTLGITALEAPTVAVHFRHRIRGCGHVGNAKRHPSYPQPCFIRFAPRALFPYRAARPYSCSDSLPKQRKNVLYASPQRGGPSVGVAVGKRNGGLLTINPKSGSLSLIGGSVAFFLPPPSWGGSVFVISV